MQLLTGGKDIIELVREITWSGDTKEVSRKLNFVIASGVELNILDISD